LKLETVTPYETLVPTYYLHVVMYRKMDIYIRIAVKVKVKVKFNLEQATKTQMGSRDIALLFL
jgi:hypothetical protein